MKVFTNKTSHKDMRCLMYKPSNEHNLNFTILLRNIEPRCYDWGQIYGTTWVIVTKEEMVKKKEHQMSIELVEGGGGLGI